MDSEAAPEYEKATPVYGLLCIECGALSSRDAAGWRAYIAYLEEDGDPPEVVVYCPACVEFEFGDS
jgi:hypothetical protein